MAPRRTAALPLLVLAAFVSEAFAQPTSAPSECRPFSDPKNVSDNFIQVSYANAEAADCSYHYLPVLFDGSVVSEYHITTSGIQLSNSTIALFDSGVATEPLLVINATDAHIHLNASSVPSGLWLTTSTDGNGQPFQLLVTTAAVCPLGQQPVGLVSFEFADESHLTNPPLTYCVNPENIISINATSLEFSTFIYTDSMPESFLPDVVTVFKPEGTSALANACYTAQVQANTSVAGADLFADAYLLFSNASAVYLTSDPVLVCLNSTNSTLESIVVTIGVPSPESQVITTLLTLTKANTTLPTAPPAILPTPPAYPPPPGNFTAPSPPFRSGAPESGPVPGSASSLKANALLTSVLGALMLLLSAL